MGAVDDRVESSDPEGARKGAQAARPLVRTVATLTVLNLVSRATGFVRAVATLAALGALTLGDTYQSANFVSNILFELLAGGLLFSVLVPTFVARLDGGDGDGARRLAGVLLARAAVILGAVAVIGALLAPAIMWGLTVGGGDAATRTAEIDLGSVLLLFFMPQLVLYAAGAVATAVLQADRRFVAAAIAPIGNNLLITASMVLFASVHGPSAAGDLDLTRTEILILGGGTLLGTVALTIVPFVALLRAGLGIRPRWRDPAVSGLAALMRRGAWGAGHIGLNQILIAATVVVAGQVVGGVIVFQTAFVFFLLPHAVLAHPIFTALYPTLSADAAAGRTEDFAVDLGRGLRAIAVVVLPGAALLAALAPAMLNVVRLGALDTRGTNLVAATLAAYATGLLGYSAFFLLTRASYALDDVRTPTLVNAAVTIVAIVAMVVLSAAVSGDSRVVVLGLAHGLAVSGGSLVQYVLLRRRLGLGVPVLAAIARGAAAAVAGGVGASLAARAVGWDTREHAAAALGAAGTVGLALVAITLIATRAPEVAVVRGRLAARRPPGRRERGGE